MQSPNQSNSGPNLMTTATTEQPLDTETEAQPAQSEPDAQGKENKSAAPAEAETPVVPQENGTWLQAAETPASMAVTQAAENEPTVQLPTEPSEETGVMEMNSASKPNAPTEPVPDTNTNPGCDRQKAKKQDKGVRDGRKYVPSKKAMIDPLKMDMSKPLVLPLTSSQLSLQCIECHIIFSDHKSKERHLKLSHPAEYEQCILRNALFACYVCDRHFTNSTELMVHQKAHIEKKPFKCPICSQAFNKSSELTLHKKIHFGRDGYACTDCGKPCKTMTLLKYHRRTHTGERPYVCKECGKRFTMSKALQKHMVAHLPEGAAEDGEDTEPKAQPKKDDALLQVEPNGPLQKVDANIDTEQICRLIESLGNVQKVNQVVILGQVPPHAPPLEVQQISQLAEPVSRQPPETLPAKPKTTRKRKASKVETEGVITSSHSKRALECKDCGEKFSEVSSLQKHKASVHIVESPGLTYTNGNVFEGVSRLDLYQLPKQQDKIAGMMNTATDWDTEPEMGEMALEDRERNVSFPSLIPSPSLPVPPSDVEMNAYEDMGGITTGAVHRSPTSLEVHPPSDEMKNSETTPNFPSVSLSESTSAQTKSLETGGPLTSDKDKQEEGTPKNPSSEFEVQGTLDEDIKEDLLLEVDLVTVGEQNERDDSASHENTVPQNELNGTCSSEGGSTGNLPGQVTDETTEKSSTLQTVSCSTHQMEIKEEEEEMLVQRKKGGKGAVVRSAMGGKRRGTGRLKRDAPSKRVSVGDTVEGTNECQELYEKHPITSDSEMNDESETGTKTSRSETSLEFEANKATAPVRSLPPIPSTLEESPKEQVVFELESVTTSVEEAMNERGLQEGEEHDRDQSPGIILEKFLTSRQRERDKEPCLMTDRINQRQGWDGLAENEVQGLGSEEIKVEENILDPPLVAVTCQNRPSASVQPQHHCDIRSVLVKEESSLVLNEAQGSRHIRWNVEPVNADNTSSSLMDNGETARDCHVIPEFNTNQCIFYPVKEEEREVLLGAAQTNNGTLTSGVSNDAPQTEHQTTDSNLNDGTHSAPDYQEMGVRGLMSEPGVSDFADGRAEADAQWQPPPDLRDFLLQSSDEEDVGGFELSDPQLDSEAEVMAYFYKNQTKSAQQLEEMSQNLPTSTSQLSPTEENRPREPTDYFTKYFGQDTWVEIANYTNKLSNTPNPVTAREVAQFVGIHIAMGTLKFPSPRLYWEDLTKVPLVAEAMPLSRFLELSRMLKLASPAKDPDSSNIGEGSKISQPSEGQSEQDMPNDLNSSKTQTDPLWKVQPLLCRFKAGCQSLRRVGDYAVDQYQLPLTGKMHSKKVSLHCTTLIGFGGLLLHVDLKLGLSGKEDAVEKMVPKGSMVFLCKQELSTPAMLERLLVAGVHGAGRVGGARGQIGDEFVSSDGKLMLRRSHCGFILSTAGNGQRNMGSLIGNFEKAQMSAHLNRDLLNLYSIPLTASAPTCWPQAVLWYLTDLALVNSWLLYRQDHRAVSAPLTLMAFRLEVSKSLILSSGSDAQDSVPPQPPIEKAHTTNETPSPCLVDESPLPDAATRYDGSGHWPEQLAEGEGGR
ncbi:hypothetical protein L3Q82_002341 [Scortum barcoo]|uniref:Uncharacterized protein n=1 Tax=Scortum barcoo TaxID=214431 RepID=A0ACB8VXW1_9TELE|nr:hypothetical protein L3Q82_002341 [Scortum barcoo]